MQSYMLKPTLMDLTFLASIVINHSGPERHLEVTWIDIIGNNFSFLAMAMTKLEPSLEIAIVIAIVISPKS